MQIQLGNGIADEQTKQASKNGEDMFLPIKIIRNRLYLDSYINS